MPTADIRNFVPLPFPAGIALAGLLGLLWLSILAPVWWRSTAAWVGVVVGGVLFAPTIAWVQVPLQTATSTAIIAAFGQQAFLSNLLLLGAPNILESGIAQEAAKLLPLLVFATVLRPRGASPLLLMGAGVGAGFGAFEAAWNFGTVFSAGWTLDVVQLAGWQGLLPFIERFLAVAFHASSGVILAFGLTRGRAPLLYIVAVLLHGAVNYGVLLAQARVLAPGTAVEVYIAAWTVVALALALWLRARDAGGRLVGFRE